MMFSASLKDRAGYLLGLCRDRKLKLVTAESCTGGLIGGLITSLAGSSDVYERGFVTYSNKAKEELLGVDAKLLSRMGAVSIPIAAQMAMGALAHSRADIAVSATGIAGPGGGTDEKPVGLVYFGVTSRNTRPEVTEKRFGDVGREKVRLLSVETAINLLIGLAGQ